MHIRIIHTRNKATLEQELLRILSRKPIRCDNKANQARRN